MTEDQITYAVRACIFNVYNHLGPGLLESVYEEALCYEIQKRGMHLERQKQVPIIYDGIELRTALVLDILVENKVIVELKSVKELKDVHYKQLMTYLKLSNLYVGLLVNFNTADLQQNIKRIYNKSAQ